MTEYEKFLARIVARKDEKVKNVIIRKYYPSTLGVIVHFDYQYGGNTVSIAHDIKDLYLSDLFEQQFIDNLGKK